MLKTTTLLLAGALGAGAYATFGSPDECLGCRLVHSVFGAPDEAVSEARGDSAAPCDSEASCDQGCCSAPATGSFTYIEARDVTVWGGACHISSEAASGGQHALSAWDFGESRVVLAVQGDRNLQGQEVFNAGGAPELRVVAWVDADDTQGALARALELAPQLPAPTVIHACPISMSTDGDRFALSVPGAVELEGAAMADRECCTMPESRWYRPLANVSHSVVGNADRCRVQGEGLEAWACEGANSVFVAQSL